MSTNATLTPPQTQAEKFTLLFYALSLFFNFVSISASQGFLVLTLLTYTYVAYERMRTKEKFLLPLTFILLFALLLWEVVSSFANPHTAESVKMLSEFWLYLPVFFLPNLIRREEDLEKLFTWLAWGAIICGLMCLLESVASIKLKDFFKGKITPMPRDYGILGPVDGFAGNLGHTGLYFLPTAYFAWKVSDSLRDGYSHYFKNFFTKRNLFYSIGFFVSAFSIIFTGRRSGILALIAVLPILFYWKSRKKTPVVLAFLFIVALFTWNNGLHQRVSTPIAGQDYSTNQRFEIYKAVVASSLKNPLFGVGEAPNNFSQLLKEENALDEHGAFLTYTDAHNDFLEKLAKGGYPAFFLFLAVFFTLSWRLLVYRKAFLRESTSSTHKYMFQEKLEVVLVSLALFFIASQFICHATNDEPLLFLSFTFASAEVLLNNFFHPHINKK